MTGRGASGININALVGGRNFPAPAEGHGREMNLGGMKQAAAIPLALQTPNPLVMVPNNLTGDRLNKSGVYGHTNIGGVMQHNLPSSSFMRPTAPFSNPIQAAYLVVYVSNNLVSELGQLVNAQVHAKDGCHGFRKNKDGVVSLRYPMLTRENYTAWAMKMRVYMQAHGVWTAIESKDPKGSSDDRVDKLALAVIYQGIPEDVLIAIAEKETAKEAWDAVKVMCQGAERVKKARVQTLKAEFEAINMKDSDSLDDFCLKMNGLVTNIRALGEEVSESYVVKKLLRAVPGKFLQIAATIEQFGNLETMTVEETIGSLKAHNERLRGHVEPSGGKLLLTQEEWARKEREDNKLLLTREEWLKRSNKNSGDASSGQRFRAGNNFCGPRDKTRIPEDEPALLLTDHEIREETVMLVHEEKVTPKLNRESNVRVESNVWYLDNGASNHMTGQKSKFEEIDETVAGQVKFGDGSIVHIKGKGSIRMRCNNGETRILGGVYYITSLCNNIISLGQLLEEGYKFIMSGEYLWVRGEQKELIMKVKRSTNRLYKIILQNCEQKCLLAEGCDVNWLWHSRLGHVNFKAMALMSAENMVHGLPRISQPSYACSGCLMSKQTRRPFPSQSSYSAKNALELVHGDLCGPITPGTPAGNSLVESGPEKKIKAFKSDRGGKFMSKDFQAYCEENGINQQFTAPYSPQQNDVVERRNRTMMEMARSLLREMKLPNYFWGEAVRHAIYLLNRLSTRAVSGITPYEAWCKRKPHLEHIRVFGCLAYMKVPTVNLKKLDDRSLPVIHLGKEPGTKAYRLYNPVSNTVHVSRDVFFVERKSWCWNSEEEPQQNMTSTFSVTYGEAPITGEQSPPPEDSVHNSGSDNASHTESESSYSSNNNTEMSEVDSSTDAESVPRKFRSPRNIYANTKPIELEDEELMLIGVDRVHKLCRGFEEK
ncbi:hypothetical protein AgCh_030354 [Apium graveolens]